MNICQKDTIFNFNWCTHMLFILFTVVPRLKETSSSFSLNFLICRHCDSTICVQATDEGKISKAKDFRWILL